MMVVSRIIFAFRQELSEYDIMTPAGHSDFATTHRFYLTVADDLTRFCQNTVSKRDKMRSLAKIDNHASILCKAI